MTEDDPFLWLEDVEGDKALDWVRAERAHPGAARSRSALPEPLRHRARRSSPPRTASPIRIFAADGLANFWQDAAHVRGLWRKTTLASYRTAEPHWETVLDIDALAAAEGKNWVYQGGQTLPPEDRLTLVGLSDGGKDASEIREFDAATAKFVAGGFILPEGKQSATWLDADTLFVARDWGPGTMTASGYPFIIKRLAARRPLDTAEEIFRGTADDVSVRAGRAARPRRHGARRRHDPRGRFLCQRAVSADRRGPIKLPLPGKASLWPSSPASWCSLSKRHGAAGTYPSGALISLDLAACHADIDAVEPLLIYAPGPRETIEGVAATRSRLLVAIYRNVRGSAVSYRSTERRLAGDAAAAAGKCLGQI
jgi:prolyl oligopeptidase